MYTTRTQKLPIYPTCGAPPAKSASRSRRLVANRVAALPDGSYSDPGQTGLQVRIRSTRNGRATRTWLLRFTFKGEATHIVLGHFPETTLDQARGLAREAREQASQGIDPRRARPRRRSRISTVEGSATFSGNKHTIEFLVQEFLELHVRTTHKQPGYVERILTREVLSETGWRGRDSRTIKPREVIELLDAIVARGSTIIANRTAGILGQMFRFGVHRAIVETSPVQLLYRPGGKESPRERCLTNDEIAILIQDPKKATRFEKLGHVMLILLLTGQRRGELALARWADVDQEKNTWRIPSEHSKTGKSHVVPLSDWATREFNTLRTLAGKSNYVLPNDADDGPSDPKLLTRGVARCLPRMKKLGIDAFTLHDLRRTCRTGLARLKIAPHIAERVLNHAQERIAATYDTHDYLEEKRLALDTWAAHLTTLKHQLTQEPKHTKNKF